MSETLEEMVARRSEAEVRRMYITLLTDTSSDEVDIETLAKRVLDPAWVDGDSYGVPGPVDIVRKLVEEIERLRAS